MIKHRFLRNKKLATAVGVIHFDKDGLSNALDATEEHKLAKKLADIKLVSKDKAKHTAKKQVSAKPNRVKAKSAKAGEKPVSKTEKAKSKAKSAQGVKKVTK